MSALAFLLLLPLAWFAALVGGVVMILFVWGLVHFVAWCWSYPRGRY